MFPKILEKLLCQNRDGGKTMVLWDDTPYGEAKMDSAGKQETLNIFSQLLKRLWERIISLIGDTAAIAVFRSALLEASQDYSLLREIEIKNDGIHLEKLQNNLENIHGSQLRSGLVAFTDSVMTLLIDLTGGILSTKLEPLVQQLKETLQES